jgi:hypothetical protein
MRGKEVSGSQISLIKMAYIRSKIRNMPSLTGTAARARRTIFGQLSRSIHHLGNHPACTGILHFEYPTVFLDLYLGDFPIVMLIP